MTRQTNTKQTPGKGLKQKRAIIFARTRSVPPDAERDQAQLTAQIRACRKVAVRHGAEVVAEYQVVGGTRAVTYEVIDRLLAQIRRDGIDYVIATSLDRFARHPGDLAYIAEYIQAAGARIVTTADSREAFIQDLKLYCFVAKEREGRAA
jgi:DNA invertase Pin-like site-specific DNA recombinase